MSPAGCKACNTPCEECKESPGNCQKCKNKYQTSILDFCPGCQCLKKKIKYTVKEKNPCSVSNGYCFIFKFFDGPKHIDFWDILKSKKEAEDLDFNHFYSPSANNTYTTKTEVDKNELELKIIPVKSDKKMKQSEFLLLPNNTKLAVHQNRELQLEQDEEEETIEATPRAYLASEASWFKNIGFGTSSILEISTISLEVITVVATLASVRDDGMFMSFS